MENPTLFYVAGCEEHDEPGPHPVFDPDNPRKTTWCHGVHLAEVADLVAVVRRGVETGTIKGEVVWLGVVDSGPDLHTAVFWDEESARWNEPRGPYLFIPTEENL